MEEISNKLVPFLIKFSPSAEDCPSFGQIPNEVSNFFVTIKPLIQIMMLLNPYYLKAPIRVIFNSVSQANNISNHQQCSSLAYPRRKGSTLTLPSLSADTRQLTRSKRSHILPIKTKQTNHPQTPNPTEPI